MNEIKIGHFFEVYILPELRVKKNQKSLSEVVVDIMLENRKN
ncbi:hypothetical protein QUA45_00755 [Microcoleus sp. Pol12A5]